MNGDAQGGPSCHASAETRGMNGHLQGVSLAAVQPASENRKIPFELNR
jgi:hypothetical protein